MLRGAVARRYAQALYELAAARGVVDTLQEELQAVAGVVAQAKELQQILFHPQVTAQEKKALLDKLFAAQVMPLTRDFIDLLVDRRRENFLIAIVEEFVELANQARNVAEAEVTSAIPLSDAEEAGLAAGLARLTGKKVKLSLKVDSGLIGGVVVRMGDMVIDGSIRARLCSLQAKLKKVQLKEIGVNQ